ncbi:hypothetical protein EG19_04035 [Thermoanaerobaculum aquaticum]|uniref:Uncharacterized protein n=1 Tax=Thermoanaerobaculum aquaticum TaxID=1312852 RepID=A0A062Y3J4_9BACT|nr:hypothetical protein EG19_04035 [Thermoanaerobaculum aquaticum]
MREQLKPCCCFCQGRGAPQKQAQQQETHHEVEAERGVKGKEKRQHGQTPEGGTPAGGSLPPGPEAQGPQVPKQEGHQKGQPQEKAGRRKKARHVPGQAGKPCGAVTGEGIPSGVKEKPKPHGA